MSTNFNKPSRIKLFKAGYMLLRATEVPMGNLDGRYVPAIKISKEDGVWCLYGKYKTKKERDAEMLKLINDPKSNYINDEI